MTLILLSERWSDDNVAHDYLLRTITHTCGSIDVQIKSAARKLVEILDRVLLDEQTIIVAAEGQEFATAAKVAATWMGTTITHRGNLLMPSCAELYDDNSFLLIKDGVQISFLRLTSDTLLSAPIIQQTPPPSACLHIFHRTKSSLEVLIEPLAAASDIEWDIIPTSGGWLRLKAISRRFGNLSLFLSSLHKLLPGQIIQAQDLWAYAVETLAKNQKRVGLSESCTGGLIASMFTAIPGSSAVFDGSVVTYANWTKESWIGVLPQTLTEHGAVSKETVQEMLAGTLRTCQSDYAIAVSGIAGPSGGTPQKPVGTVWIGAKAKEREPVIEPFLFVGDRQAIREQAAHHALRLLFECDPALFFAKNT